VVGITELSAIMASLKEAKITALDHCDALDLMRHKSNNRGPQAD
jgi:hypothetical protein